MEFLKTLILNENEVEKAADIIKSGGLVAMPTETVYGLAANALDMEAAKEKGLRVPEDFGIVGTANEHFTSLITPSLSSMAQHPYEMGRRAAMAFLTSLKPGAKVGEIVVPMDLIARESSKRISK